MLTPLGGPGPVMVGQGISQDAVKPGDRGFLLGQIIRVPDGFEQAPLEHILGFRLMRFHPHKNRNREEAGI